MVSRCHDTIDGYYASQQTCVCWFETCHAQEFHNVGVRVRFPPVSQFTLDLTAPILGTTYNTYLVRIWGISWWGGLCVHHMYVLTTGPAIDDYYASQQTCVCWFETCHMQEFHNVGDWVQLPPMSHFMLT